MFYKELFTFSTQNNVGKTYYYAPVGYKII